MESIFIYLPFYLLLGAIGMALANRKAKPSVRKQRWLKYFVYVLVTAMIIASIFFDFFYFIAALIITAGLAELLRLNKKLKAENFVSVIIFLIVSAGFLLFAFKFGPPWLLFVYFQVFIFDAFGQITGQLIGKNRLVPRISPGKTVEGLAGSIFFCLVAAIIGSGWVKQTVTIALLFGLISSATCVSGDLLASWFKRKMKIKDYSNWLPGQGGVLDRFDSFIFSGFVYWLLTLILKNISFQS